MINKRIWQVSLVVAALMAITGVAAASEHEDTMINSGYDDENHILVFNTSSTDGTYDCTLQTTEDPDDPENTEYTVTYAFVTEDGLIEVEGLTSDGGDVSFSEREGDGEAIYGETDGECDLQAIDVTGPVGQVNHGTFISAIATLYDGPHRGCVISTFARSDLGKDEQQINAPDVEESDPDAEPATEGTVQFTTIVADCDRTTQENGETADNGNGRPDWAGQGRPEWAGQKGGPNAAGNSGSAPGRDR